MTDPVVIKPKTAPLSVREDSATPADTPEPGGASPRSLQRAGLALAILLALLALYWVFVVLPGTVSPSVARSANNEASAATDAQPGTARPSAAEPASISPFRDTQLQRAKQQAEKELARFVELQIELEEQLQVSAWGQERYDAVKDLATRGDSEFVARDFDAALASYAAATQGLVELRALGEAEYQSGIDKGRAALKDFNQLLATREFNRALQIKADDAAALDGLARAEQLPEIQALLRKARQLARRGDTQAATRTYQEVLSIDAQTATVAEALAELQEETTNANFQDALSEGFAALERKRYAAARAAFNKALQIRPGDSVAQGGLQQIAQETEVRGLQELRNRALKAVREERWSDAVAAFDEALKRDRNLAFAQDGRDKAATRARLTRGMQIIVSQAEKLSDNKRMQEAEELLASATSLASAGPQWDGDLTRARQTVASYKQPVPVRLTSDNRTQITVYKVGRIGAFETHDLSLRPGVYTIVGSRDGCQDVRKEVVVKPQMPPINIACENRL